MLEKFRDYIVEHKLCRNGDHILLAVSGGIDSMVMVDLFHKSGSGFSIVHCNFSLREGESDKDEALVKEIAVGHNVLFLSKKFDTKQYAKQKKLSIQLAARELRYSWFKELLKKGAGDKIATAHHLNDQLETVILNLAKGTGIKGISGIPVKTGRIIRPLLFASREEITAYAKNNNIKWREDASNASIKYQRNFIRHEIVPSLEKVNPSLLETFERSSKRLKESNEILLEVIDNFRDRYVKKAGPDSYIIIEDILDKNATFLQLLLEPFGLNYNQSESLKKCLNNPSTGNLFVTRTHQLNIDRGQLVISPIETAFDPVIIEEGSGGIPGKVLIEKLSAEKVKIVPDKNIAFLDSEGVKFPLKLRTWMEGDRFIPLGMKGQKKLSDFMIDNKIPVNLKNRILVLESGKDIIWVVGHRVDERFKVTEKTKTVCKVTWLDEKSI